MQLRPDPGYIAKRVSRMNYKALADRDLELGTGPVEGRIQHRQAAPLPTVLAEAA